MILEYVGVTKNGERVTGEFLGSKDELIRSLQKEGIFIVSVRESKRKKKRGKYTIEDFATEVEELSYLVSAGLQIDKAISTMIKNTKKEASVEIWEMVLTQLKEGNQLSVAIKNVLKEKRIPISDFYINIISVGEEVGNVQQALKDVSKHLQFRLKIKRDTISALGYPIFLVFVSIVAIFFVAYFILPRFSSIFTPKEFKTLPALSKVFIGFGMFIHNNMGMVLSLFFMFIALIVFVFSLEKPRRLILDFIQGLPFLKDIALEFHIANLCSSLGAMLEGGVDIGRALRLAAKITSHRNLKNIVLQTAENVKRGIKISDTWSKYSIIPDDVVSLVAVGESSATLGEVFSKLGEKHLEDFKIKISRAMVFLEPAMIVMLGVFIGLIVVSIMLAVLSLTNVS